MDQRYGEPWTPYSLIQVGSAGETSPLNLTLTLSSVPLQLLGFALLLTGVAIYNKLILLPCCNYDEVVPVVSPLQNPFALTDSFCFRNNLHFTSRRYSSAG